MTVGVESAGSSAPTWLGAPWWDAITAIGTLLAVLVAVGVAAYEAVRAHRAESALKRERADRAADEREAVAALVTATVEVDAEPSEDASHYVQRARLQIANESPEPVFNVRVLVAVSDPPIPIGPLAAPTPLPVLPARHSRSWDVTLGLLAHSPILATLGQHPRIELFFSDGRGVRWHRGYDGELTESDNTPAPILQEISEDSEAQLGNLDNPFNPMTVALGFIGAVTSTDPPVTVDELRVALAPNAPGWANFTDGDLQALRSEFTDYGVAAHAWYPAPFVAWVRLVHDEDSTVELTPGEVREVRAKVLTLCYLPGLGWRVFGLGATEPDWIQFPPGTLSDDPRREPHL